MRLDVRWVVDVMQERALSDSNRGGCWVLLGIVAVVAKRFSREPQWFKSMVEEPLIFGCICKHPDPEVTAL